MGQDKNIYFYWCDFLFFYRFETDLDVNGIISVRHYYLLLIIQVPTTYSFTQPIS